MPACHATKLDHLLSLRSLLQEILMGAQEPDMNCMRIELSVSRAQIDLHLSQSIRQESD